MNCFERKGIETVRFGKKEAPTPTFVPLLSFLTTISFLILFILLSLYFYLFKSWLVTWLAR